MELPLSLQGNQFLLSAVVGLGYGLHYDLLRGLRRNAKWLTHILDLWFALTFLIGNVFVAIYLGNGQFRIFMFVAVILGMAVWFLLFSRPILWLFEKVWAIIFAPFRILSRFCEKNLKKMKKLLKNIFSFVKKRVIIKGKNHTTEGKNGAHLQIVTHYQISHTCPDDLCDRHDRHTTAKDR